MRNIAIVALPDAYVASAGALADAVELISERRTRVLANAPAETELQLRMVWPGISPRPGKDWPDVSTAQSINGPYEQFDFIWLPAFRIGPPKLAVERIRDLGSLGEWLIRQWKGGAVIGASGSAVLLLIEHRLLTARRIPVSTALYPLIQALYPRFGKDDRQPILQQGNVYISSGFGHDIELVARVLERLASPASSTWYRSVAGIERVGQPDLVEDPLVSAAQLRIEQQFASGLSISGLAADLATSHPTLIRRFHKALGMTPGEYLRDQRLAAAKRLLVQTSRSISAIAQMVGFSDPRSFRDLFRSAEGISARTYRRTAANPPKDHIGD